MKKQTKEGGIIAALDTKKENYVVAIDPDVEKSGVCLIGKEQKKILTLCAMTFPQLLDLLGIYKSQWEGEVCVYIELPHSEHNWQIQARARHARNAVAYAANAGVDVGRCRQVAILLKEWCDYAGIKAKLVQPLVKIWGNGKDKINAQEFADLSGWTGRTNGEMRDAGLLAWYHSNLPIRLKPKK